MPAMQGCLKPIASACKVGTHCPNKPRPSLPPPEKAMPQTPNVDAAEIDKFSRLAAQWWNPDGEFKSLHEINPLRLGFIREHSGGLTGKNVLDVGCGGGILSEALAREAAQATGIDMAEKSLQVAQAHAEQQGLANLHYRCISVEALAAEQPAAYDVVTCMEMLEHVPDPASVISACAKLVKPGGSLFFSTLSRTAKSYAQAIIAAEYLLGLVAKGTHDWQRFINPADLARLCRQAGLNITATSGLTYNPLTRRYRLCHRTDVNYMIACRPIGTA